MTQWVGAGVELGSRVMVVMLVVVVLLMLLLLLMLLMLLLLLMWWRRWCQRCQYWRFLAEAVRASVGLTVVCTGCC